jgi:aldose 1-epimerase
MMKRIFTMIVAGILLGTTMGAQAQTRPAYVEMKRDAFRKEIGGKKTDLYTLETGTGMTVKITNQGGKIVQILVPDKDNRLGDVVLGYETIDQYVAGRASFGAIIGRFANRIAKGRFTLDGRDYQLPVNNGPNHLHGGRAASSSCSTRGNSTDERSSSPTTSRTAKRATRATPPSRSSTR